MEPKAAETAIVPRTVEEERALLEKQRLRTERKELRKRERFAHLDALVSRVKNDAAEHVALKRHMFKTDEELDALRLTAQQKKIVRQWEEPKKATAFGVESSAKLIEAETRSRADKGGLSVNVEKLIVKLPDKGAALLPAPVFIDVEVHKK
jgi:hypothetical protein